MTHNRVLWILQWVFGLYFIGVGMTHLVVPEGLPDPLSWLYDLGDAQHIFAGVAEILGGLGLILPSVTRIRPELTPIAGIGLIVVMIAAAVWHLGRDELSNVGVNLLNAAVLAYISYGRWRLAPVTR